MIFRSVNYKVSEYVSKLKLNINNRWLRGSSRVTIVNHSGKPNHGVKPLDVKGEYINKWRWYREV